MQSPQLLVDCKPSVVGHRGLQYASKPQWVVDLCDPLRRAPSVYVYSKRSAQSRSARTLLRMSLTRGHAPVESDSVRAAGV